MTRILKLRRLDDGVEFEVHEVTTYKIIQDGNTQRKVANPLKELVSPDGRDIYSTDEVNFFFDREMRRPMQIID